MNMNEFAKAVHQNAVEHGWWEEERSFGEIVALCHSELSEALEEFRAGRPMVWRKCMTCDSDTPCMEGGCGDWTDGVCELSCLSPKPEGIAVEMADCIIRILDWCGKMGLNADELLEDAKHNIFCDLVLPCVYNGKIGDYISWWHSILSAAYNSWNMYGDVEAAALRMARCILEIESWADAVGLDMETILDIKHEYNRTRPYRHGGKAL